MTVTVMVVQQDLTLWHLHSACADPDISADIWFDDADTARRICGRCPVRNACLQYAMDVEADGERLHGVWGGLSPIQRQRLRENPESLDRMRRVRSKTRLRSLPSPRIKAEQPQPKHELHPVQLTLIDLTQHTA
jgi:WhiB family redox-sensing transcriptional regulator